MRPAALAMTLLALAAPSCTPLRRVFGVTCISGGCPSVGRPLPDEEYRVMYAQLRRLDALRPVHQAAVLEQLPTWFPDVSDMAPEPECATELVTRMEREFFARTPVEFSRLQIGRIHAVSRVSDTTDVMAQKGRFLRRVARLRDADVGPWQAQPEESSLGDAPRPTLQRAAVLGLARSNLVNNDPPTVEFFRERLRATDDAWERLALVGHAQMELQESYATRFRARFDEVRRLLLKPPDRVSVELLLQWLPALARLAAEGEPARAVRALCDEIVTRRGQFAITQGVHGAARDLTLAALTAGYDVEHPGGQGADLSDPPASRAVLRFEDDPWLGEVIPSHMASTDEAERDRARYAETLARELATLRFNRPRCRMMHEMARWVTPAEAPSFARMLDAPLRAPGRIALTSENSCRIAVLGAMDPTPDAARVALLLSLYDLDASRLSAQDLSLEEHHAAIAYTPSTSFRPEVMAALGSHPALVAQDARVRAWVTRWVVSGRDTDEDSAARLASHGLVDALLAWLARSPDAAHREEGRALLVHGLALVERRLGASAHDLYAVWHAARWIYTLAEHARGFGVEAEVRALLTSLRAREGVTPMSATMANGQRWLQRVARVAEFMLDTPELTPTEAHTALAVPMRAE